MFCVRVARSYLSMKTKGSSSRSFVVWEVWLHATAEVFLTNRCAQARCAALGIGGVWLGLLRSIEGCLSDRSACARVLRKRSRVGCFEVKIFLIFFCDHQPGGPPKRCMACTLFIARDKNSSALIGLPLWKNHQATRNPTPAPMR